MNERAPARETPGSPALSPEDRAVIDDELRRIRSESGSTSPQGRGCLVAFAGMVLMTLVPAVGNWLEIPREVAFTLLGAAVLLLAVGAGLAIFGAALAPSRQRLVGEASSVVQAYCGRGRPTDAHAAGRASGVGGSGDASANHPSPPGPDRATALRAATRLAEAGVAVQDPTRPLLEPVVRYLAEAQTHRG